MRELKKQGVRGFRIHPATEPVDAWLSSDGMIGAVGGWAPKNAWPCAA